MRVFGGGHLVASILAALCRAVPLPVNDRQSSYSGDLPRKQGAASNGLKERSESWDEVEALLELLAVLLKVGAAAANTPVSSEKLPTIAEVEEALFSGKGAMGTRRWRISKEGARSNLARTTLGPHACDGHSVVTEGAEPTPCCTSERAPTSILPAEAMERGLSTTGGEDVLIAEASNTEITWPRAKTMPANERTSGEDIQAETLMQSGGLFEPRQPDLDAMKGLSSGATNLCGAASHRGAESLIPSPTSNAERSGKQQSTHTRGAESIHALPAGFVARSRTGSTRSVGPGGKVVKSMPASPAKRKVPAREFELCGCNFVALLIVRWVSHDHLGSGEGLTCRNESGFQLIARLALSHPPPVNERWWVYVLNWLKFTRRRPLQDVGDFARANGRWWWTGKENPSHGGKCSLIGSRVETGAGARAGFGSSDLLDRQHRFERVYDLDNRSTDIPETPRRQRVFATEILRDHFLTQVTYKMSVDVLLMLSC